MLNLLNKYILPLAMVLAFAGACLAVQDSGQQQSVLSQGDVCEMPLLPGEYAYCIDYLDGDMFVTVNTQFIGPEGLVLAEASHTLIRGQRMRVRKQFRTESVSELAAPMRIRFACNSGSVRVSLLSSEVEQPS